MLVDNFPRLARTKAFFVIAVLGTPTLVAITMLKSGAGLPVILLVYAVLAMFANAITQGMGQLVPVKYRTVASLIPYVKCSSSKLWTRDDVLKKVLEITAECLGIRLDEIRPDSHFVNDLGAD
ncbi:MAG: hypothetical protein BVN35_19315 [Proteobacteria bacterium ST_bin11]|nr:MAG: hypothetical protein BVN35_19315 [Proteobacteria bacterium ST_bin11]